jgi:hypothetical protein
MCPFSVDFQHWHLSHWETFKFSTKKKEEKEKGKMMVSWNFFYFYLFDYEISSKKLHFLENWAKFFSMNWIFWPGPVTSWHLITWKCTHTEQFFPGKGKTISQIIEQRVSIHLEFGEIIFRWIFELLEHYLVNDSEVLSKLHIIIWPYSPFILIWICYAKII